MTDHGDSPVDHGTPDVLLVEDNDSDHMLLSRQVKKILTPQRCERAANRIELLRALTQPWSLIITDLHLPDIEETGLLETIEAAQPYTPCLILTGSSQEAHRFGIHGNVFRVIEKGDSSALQTALGGRWHK